MARLRAFGAIAGPGEDTRAEAITGNGTCLHDRPQRRGVRDEDSTRFKPRSETQSPPSWTQTVVFGTREGGFRVSERRFNAVYSAYPADALGDGGVEALDLCVGVGAGEREAVVPAGRRAGVVDERGEDPLLPEAVAQYTVLLGIQEGDGADGRKPVRDAEPQGAQSRLPLRTAGAQEGDLLRLRLQDLDGTAAGGGDRERHGRAACEGAAV